MAKQARPYTIHVYQDQARGWRWRMKAPNGRIVADGAEGYSNRRAAERAALKLVGVEILVAMPAVKS